MNNLELTKLTLTDGFIGKLQEKTISHLFKHCYIQIGNIKINPIEIEVYYFEEGVLEDDSVHKNELQKNNKNHFYIHRFGKGKNNKYKGRAGIDFVWSNKDNQYYTWLLRSVTLEKGEEKTTVVGPNKTLMAIKEWTNLSNEELESAKLELKYESAINENYPIFTSERIGLVNDSAIFKFAPLRFVTAKSDYHQHKFKLMSKMVINFCQKIYNANAVDKAYCLGLCDKYLKYKPKEIKEL